MFNPVKAIFSPVSMSDKRFSEISDRVRESYPNACILYIDEVMNLPLLQSFEQLKNSRTFEVKQLFHGTYNNLINIISSEGFDPTKTRTAAYGYGTYFAKNASYSFNYMKSKVDVTYMFLADVLVGRLTTLQTKLGDWDNNVDNLKNPTIYTTPYPNGAYPRYVIAFHKNAK